MSDGEGRIDEEPNPALLCRAPPDVDLAPSTTFEESDFSSMCGGRMAADCTGDDNVIIIMSEVVVAMSRSRRRSDDDVVVER